jgi:hypothetical protein
MNCPIGLITIVLMSFFSDFAEISNRNYLDNLGSSL